MPDILFGRAGFLRFLMEGVLCAKTLPRLLAIQNVFVSGMALGIAAWCWAGCPFGGFGFVAAVTSSNLMLAFVLWILLLGRILLFYPFPTCKKSPCSTIADYNWDARFIFGRAGWNSYIYECRCGDFYLRHGRRFLIVVEPEPGPEEHPEKSRDVRITGANTRPYVKLTGFRTWACDDNPSGYQGR